jgi:hypothetical protein
MAEEADKDAHGFRMNQGTPSTEYDRGFTDAVKLFTNCLRMAAQTVEPDTYGTVTKQDTGHSFKAVIRTGDQVYARRLRELANQIEESFLK